MIKRILVGVGGSPDSSAKQAIAIDLAKKHGASLTLMSVADTDRLRRTGPVPMGASHYAEHLVETRFEQLHTRAEESLKAMSSAAESAGVPVSVVRLEGDPVDAISKVWRYHDLVLLGVRAWFEHGVVDEPEDALLRLVMSGVKPILAVTEHCPTLTRGMVAFDGSKEAAKAMKSFAQMNLLPDTAVDVACVGQSETGEDPADLLDDASAYLRAHGYDAKPRILHGQRPVEVLDRHATENGIDLIVAGSSQMHTLLSKRFGRNTLGLIRHTHCCLLITS